MEDKAAGFLNMVMDRLHALESKVDKQQKEIQRLTEVKGTMEHALLMTPHILPGDLKEFSNGGVLVWVVGQEPQLLVNNPNPNPDPTESRSMIVDMDAAHLQATMFYGRREVSMTCNGPVARQSSSMNVGKPSKCTTVADFTNTVNQFALSRNVDDLGKWVMGMEDTQCRITFRTIVMPAHLLLDLA